MIQWKKGSVNTKKDALKIPKLKHKFKKKKKINRG